MYNIRYGLSYLLHRFKSNNRHGIHSPYVYKLIDTVIYDYRTQKVYREIADIIRQQDPDKRVINTLPFKVYQLIYRLAVYFRPATVVFAGEEDGILSVPIKRAVPDAHFLNLSKSTGEGSPDLVIIDAAKHSIIQSLQNCLDFIHDDTILMFASIHRTKKTKEDWEVLKTDERVRVTIDLYYLGLVFFKPGMSKEDFKVRY